MDCIIILGGGINKNCTLPDWCIDRCNLAIKIFKKYNSSIICTSGGSYHNPNPLDKDGFVIHECDALANYLFSKGVPKEKIFKEWTSYDTIGNAYFSKILLIDSFNWKNITVVTSDFHMDRSKIIFNYLFPKENYTLNFESCQYLNKSKNLEERILKENRSSINFRNLINKISSKYDFSKWIYNEHQCYTSIPNKKEKIDSLLLYNQN